MWGPCGQGSTDLLLLMSRSVSRPQWHNAFLPCHKADTEASRDKRGNMTGAYHEKRALPLCGPHCTSCPALIGGV